MSSPSSGHTTPHGIASRSRSRSPLIQSAATSPRGLGLGPSRLSRGSRSSMIDLELDRERRASDNEDDNTSGEENDGNVSTEEEDNHRAGLTRPSIQRNLTSGRTITLHTRSRSPLRKSSAESRSSDQDDSTGFTPPYTHSPFIAPTHPHPYLDPSHLFDAHSAHEELLSKSDPFLLDRSFTINEPVGSLSTSPSNRDICLASRKGLFILDMEFTDMAPRKIPQGGTWQIADCQWSPHPSTSNLILTTSSQKLLVWDLLSTSPSTSLSRIIPACNRAVTDINWHATLPDLAATTGMDGSVKVWDLRVRLEATAMGTGGATNRLSEWGSAGTQVKWNRRHENILASSHDNTVRIWDTRKGSVPVTAFAAHSGRIYGIDWDRRTRHQIVTCSLDKTIKFWSIDELDQAVSSRYLKNPYFPSLPSPQAPDEVIVTNNPVWRARNLPFGKGVLSLPQRGDSSLQMWGKGNNTNSPIERFEEFNAPVKDFVWRTRGGADAAFEDREFQLVTWCKDRQLRVTPISAHTLEKAGYKKGAKIDMLVSRRNAPNISYASWDHGLTSTMGHPKETHLTSSESGSFPFSDDNPARSRVMSVRTKIEATQAAGAVPRIRGKTMNGSVIAAGAKATMTRGTVGGRSKRNKEVDKMDWIGGITTMRGKHSASQSTETSQDPSRMGSMIMRMTNSGSRGHSTERQPLSVLTAALVNRAAGGMTIAPRRYSDHTDEFAEDGLAVDLADEIRQVKRVYPRVKFKSADLDFRKRKCSVGVNGPWGENGHFVYVQAFFRFPRTIKDGSPICEIANNVQIAEETRVQIEKELNKICDSENECLLPCVQYLIAADERKARAPAPAEDSGSDSDPEASHPIHQTTPRTSGASFGPNGELVSFFPKTTISKRRVVSSSRSPTRESASRPQVSLLRAMAALSRLSLPKDGRARHGPLAMAVGDAFASPYSLGAFRGNHRSHERAQPFVKPSTVLQIRAFAPTIPRQAELAKAYKIRGGEDACRWNARVAKSQGSPALTILWESLSVALCQSPLKVDSGRHRPFRRTRESKVGKAKVDGSMIEGILQRLTQQRDVQTLAVVLVIVAEEMLARQTSAQHPAQPIEKVSRLQVTSRDDYFDRERISSAQRGFVQRSARDAASGFITLASPTLPWVNSSTFSFLPSMSLKSSHAAARTRQDSDVSLYQPETGLSRPVAVAAGLRRKDRSASPRKDSFRSQILSRNAESFSPDLEGISSLRSSTMPPLSASAFRLDSNTMPHRQSSLAPALDSPNSPTNRRAVSQLARLSQPTQSPSTEQYLPWNIDAKDDRDCVYAGPKLLDSSRIAEYECWRRSYADLLFRWELFQERAEILKLQLREIVSRRDDREIRIDIGTSSKDDEDEPPRHLQSLDIAIPCLVCGEEMWQRGMRTTCSKCQSGPPWPTCAVCRLPVKGLAKTCYLCSHVSHQACSDGHSATVRCVAGCDCECEAEGGFRGMMDSTVKGFETRRNNGRRASMPTSLSALGLLREQSSVPERVLESDEEALSPVEVKPSRGVGAYARAQVKNWLA